MSIDNEIMPPQISHDNLQRAIADSLSPVYTHIDLTIPAQRIISERVRKLVEITESSQVQESAQRNQVEVIK